MELTEGKESFWKGEFGRGKKGKEEGTTAIPAYEGLKVIPANYKNRKGCGNNGPKKLEI